MKAPLTIACIALALIPVAALVQASAAPTPTIKPAPAATWELVQYYKGDVFGLDRGMSHDDCDDALPRNQAAKGLRFSCEVEA